MLDSIFLLYPFLQNEINFRKSTRGHYNSLKSYNQEDVSIHRTNLKYCDKAPKTQSHFILILGKAITSFVG